MVLLCPNHHAAVHRDDAPFDYGDLAFRFSVGRTEALQLMVEGEKRRLWIPEALAYKGAREPKGMLVFDVELLSVLSTPPDVKAPPASQKLLAMLTTHSKIEE